ncbi:MAG: ATP-binding protein [Pseudomonadota bacterium]
MKSKKSLLQYLFPNTLAWRLFVLSSIAALLGVVAVAFFVAADYRKSAESRLEELLTANIFNLMGRVQTHLDNQLFGSPDLGDARYSLFDSGWYWSIDEVGVRGNRIASPSLSDRDIVVPESSAFDDTFQRTFEFIDDNGQVLEGLEAQVYLGDGDNLFSFKITANRSSLEKEISEFTRRLFFILAVFALTMVLAMSQLVRIGLRPVSKAANILTKVRNGEAERIDGSYPEEIQPFVDETNALIESNNTIIERARTQVGNLAHSLKTPLAVLQNEAADLPKARKTLFQEQIETMRQQVQVYLDRARISARSSTAISRTPVFGELEKLVKVISKLNPHLDIGSQFDALNGVDFSGEVNDFQEIIGNLLENASKYSVGEIAVTGRSLENSFVIEVEDDGEGMSEKEIEIAMRRGGRVDEAKTGWGLGLSIVKDIVGEYSGSFELSKSKLGGLKAIVTLPLAK